MNCGYARVSTREQDFSGQVAELKAAGCEKVISEKASGKRGDRVGLAKAIKRLQPGDVLVVTRLDRLARSTRDLLNVLAAVTERGSGFRSLKDACRTRTSEGRERAKAKGVRFGRPLKLSAHQRREALARLNAGDAVVDVAASYGVDRATMYRLQAAAEGPLHTQ
jgi:DNA invertase Pin-like site-specific DNA recombinase